MGSLMALGGALAVMKQCQQLGSPQLTAQGPRLQAMQATVLLRSAWPQAGLRCS